ncbi:L-aspartate oxidase [Radiobacillus sp. PE A8.2]|uniref:L-aspartate oxidase n=1 Tax=Radiobacillus sp. PE A8.2 TaxID=3380349 RepID=UPI00388F8113
MIKKNIVIVGSGLAALTVADKLSEHAQMNVIILTKSNKQHSNSVRAQGGIAAALENTDNWQAHFTDTIEAGCHINNPYTTQVLVEKGPAYIEKLITQGLSFDTNPDGKLLFGKEGAHLHRRILHAGGDRTGKVIMQFMMNRIENKVAIVEDQAVVDLIVADGHCVGVVACDSNDAHTTYAADNVILATGGCGGLFEVTSNDPTIVGDGIALAYHAGATLADLEFIQFHPTMLQVGGKAYGLVSEAVRGEGATLVNADGTRIMQTVHPLADLAPRDVVAREIHTQMLNGNQIYLDISMIDDFAVKFPTITSFCEKASINIDTGLIPVAPGAHFLMGGVKTNAVGQTSVKGLYAVGEVACTGVHGANRLASNSLLEGIVFGNLVANNIIKKAMQNNIKRQIPKHSPVRVSPIKVPSKQEIKQIMTTFAGIERTHEGLEKAKKWLEQFNVKENLQMHVMNCTKEQMEIIHMLTTAWLVVTSAQARKESRGGHYRKDYPFGDDKIWLNQSIIRSKEEDMAQSHSIAIGGSR